jgi:hypothetical protein
VIVDDLYVVGVPVVPDEADTVLIVDTNAVLAPSVPRKRFKPVAGESCEVTELASCMQLLQLPLGNTGYLLKPSAEPAREERLGLSIFERPNHLIEGITPSVIRQAL